MNSYKIATFPVGHWLLLPVKLRVTELNAWKNMSLGSTFRCMCNYQWWV